MQHHLMPHRCVIQLGSCTLGQVDFISHLRIIGATTNNPMRKNDCILKLSVQVGRWVDVGFFCTQLEKPHTIWHSCGVSRLSTILLSIIWCKVFLIDCHIQYPGWLWAFLMVQASHLWKANIVGLLLLWQLQKRKKKNGLSQLSLDMASVLPLKAIYIKR